MPIERNYQEYPVESPPGRRVNYWLPDRKDFQMRQYHCTCGSKFCAMLNGPAYTETTMVHSVDLLKAELQDESQWKTLFDPEGYSKNCGKSLDAGRDTMFANWDLDRKIPLGFAHSNMGLEGSRTREIPQSLRRSPR